MHKGWVAGAGLASVVATGLAVHVDAQKAVAPKARYQMDVTTASGMPGMAGGGAAGAKPRGGLGAILGGGMAAMMGGGGPRHDLELRLGSTLSASSAPAAPA